MISINHRILFLATAFLWQGATQCSTPPVSPIQGTITLSKDWKPVAYLVQPRNFAEIATNYSGVVVDSAAIAPDGHFAFSKVSLTSGKTLFLICVQKNGNRFPNQLLDQNPLVSNYMPLVLQEGEHMAIKAEADRFQSSFAIQKPSAENLALLQLRDIRHAAYQQEERFLAAAGHDDEAALLQHEDALQRFRQSLMAFADSSTLFLPALVAVRWVSPESDYERTPEFLFRQCEKWRSQVPADPWAEQLCKVGNRAHLPVMTGDLIPDYPLPLTSGDTLRMHTLLGARLTILDIWASWCMPCRRENRDVLSPLWVQYKDSGLQIVGYSIDSSPAAWKAAITKDQASWQHASHLSGDATPFLETLRISTIPANFILDAQGKVLAKNLHGEALKVFVADYLK